MLSNTSSLQSINLTVFYFLRLQKKNRMPANVSLMFGVSPPFPNDRNFLHMSNHTCFSSSYSVLQNQSSFSRVPTMELKSPRSCLKLNQRQPKPITDSERQNDGEQNGFNAFDECRNRHSKNKKGKKVTFADRNGGVLTFIKYLFESTHEPPKSLTSDDFIRGLMKNMKIKPEETPADNNMKLVLKFNQPAADYMKFKLKLETLNVSLENVAIKSIDSVHGTVKVKNIAFEKTVTVRLTIDNWQTHKDVLCEFVNNAYDGGIYDTFQFTIDIPTNSNQVQFCVRYQCNSNEYWDSNGGGNYFIERPTHQSRPVSAPQTIPSRNLSQKMPYPSTYGELPSPQDRTWLPIHEGTPFY